MLEQPGEGRVLFVVRAHQFLKNVGNLPGPFYFEKYRVLGWCPWHVWSESNTISRKTI
jgi:hypothetical protein